MKTVYCLDKLQIVRCNKPENHSTLCVFTTEQTSHLEVI